MVAEAGLSFPFAPGAFLPARPAFSGFTARMQVNFVQKISTLASMCFECLTWPHLYSADGKDLSAQEERSRKPLSLLEPMTGKRKCKPHSLFR